MIAYERLDGAWDVFIFEPGGSIPELEAQRVDEDHIFFARIGCLARLDGAVKEIHDRIGDGYEPSMYYVEEGRRVMIGRIIDRVRSLGGQHVSVMSGGEGRWELWLRKKDFVIAEEVIASNVAGSKFDSNRAAI